MEPIGAGQYLDMGAGAWMAPHGCGDRARPATRVPAHPIRAPSTNLRGHRRHAHEISILATCLRFRDLRTIPRRGRPPLAVDRYRSRPNCSACTCGASSYIYVAVLTPVHDRGHASTSASREFRYRYSEPLLYDGHCQCPDWGHLLTIPKARGQRGVRDSAVTRVPGSRGLALLLARDQV